MGLKLFFLVTRDETKIDNVSRQQMLQSFILLIHNRPHNLLYDVILFFHFMIINETILKEFVVCT